MTTPARATSVGGIEPVLNLTANPLSGQLPVLPLWGM